MADATTWLTEEERTAVSDAVIDAERGTSAEIVPAVASESSDYPQVASLLGFLGSLLMLSIAWMLTEGQGSQDGQWYEDPWHVAFRLPVLLGAACLGYIVVPRMLVTDAATRLIASDEDLDDSVLMAAHTLFHDRRIHHTERRTGVLIYVSLLERRAAIVADTTVLETVTQDGVDALRDHLVERLHAGERAEALTSTIKRLGERLARSLPSTGSDENALPDALVILD